MLVDEITSSGTSHRGNHKASQQSMMATDSEAEVDETSRCPEQAGQMTLGPSGEVSMIVDNEEGCHDTGCGTLEEVVERDVDRNEPKGVEEPSDPDDSGVSDERCLEGGDRPEFDSYSDEEEENDEATTRREEENLFDLHAAVEVLSAVLVSIGGHMCLCNCSTAASQGDY